MKTVKNKLVLFGAGKIGRSFIGQIFSSGGYEIVFVDISKTIIEELNRKKCYHVWFVNDELKKCLTVKNVRGIHASNEEEVMNEVSTASFVAISVGVGALSQTLPLIAKSLLKRYLAGNHDPLDIIIAENMVNAADYLRDELSKYIHNLGHSAAAYIGYFYYPNLGYIYEALSIKKIFDQVKNAMLQAAAILIKKYPDEFTMKDMINHVDDLLRRFQNKALGDTVFRVGCDLRRKLGAEDRLVGVIKSAVALGMPYDAILNALVCANYFTARGPNGQVLDKDINFLKDYGNNLPILLSEICGFDIVNDANIFTEAGTIYNNLNVIQLN